MAIEINVEAVIAVSEHGHVPTVLAAFQTHGSRSTMVGPEEWSDASEVLAFKDLVRDLQEVGVREEHCQVTFRETLRSLQRLIHRRRTPRELERVILDRLGISESDIPAGAFSSGDIWIFEGPEDQAFLRRIRKTFFAAEESVTPGSIRSRLYGERQIARMYPTLHVATVVVIKVPGWWLFFINNFPTSYRLVPRVFWSDGLEKLQIAKFLLDRH